MDPVVNGGDSEGGASAEVGRARAAAPLERCLRKGMISSLPLVVAYGGVPHISPPTPWTGNGAPGMIMRRPVRT